MKKWIPSVCLAVFLSNFRVSADVISGTVVDSATLNGLDSVRVSCGLAYVTYTASNGAFTLNTASGVLNHTPVARKNVKISYQVSNLQGGIVRQISLNKPDFSCLPPGIYIVTEKAAGWSPVSYKGCNVLNVLNALPASISATDRRNGIAKVQADAVGADTLTFITAGYLSAQRITAGSQSGIIVKLRKAPVISGMRYLPGGTFQMGSNSMAPYATPVHSVTVSSFYMDTTDVTQASYQALMGVNPSMFDSGVSAPRRPAEGMTWYDAALYCNARSKHDGYDTVYSYTFIGFWSGGTAGNGCDTLGNLAIDYTKHGYRLPTEAEWEYACRAGSTADYYWGQSYLTQTTADTAEISAHAWWWYDNTPYGTKPVATKPPNGWGLYDMAGNVRQWCNDWWGSYSDSSQINPTGPASGSSRVLRGGSWRDDLYNLRSASRLGFNPNSRDGDRGFRCVRR